MRRALPLLVCAALLAPLAAVAGTLCGTVTDQQTSAPVAHAGIFLRTPAGPYTGIHGATDLTGAFCIGAIPPATYDVEVRVDDYRVAYLRGVVVTGAVTDVDVGAAPASLRLAPPWPNPAAIDTRIRWTLATPARVEISILDAAGRNVRGWGGGVLPPGEHALTWDLRDAGGAAVPPGLYFVRLDAGRDRLVRPIVRIR